MEKILKPPTVINCPSQVPLERSFLSGGAFSSKLWKFAIASETPNTVNALKAAGLAKAISRTIESSLIDVFAPIDESKETREILLSPSNIRFLMPSDLLIEEAYDAILFLEDKSSLAEIGFNGIGYYQTTLPEREKAKEGLQIAGINDKFIYVSLDDGTKKPLYNQKDKLAQIASALSRKIQCVVGSSGQTIFLAGQVKAFLNISFREQAALASLSECIVSSRLGIAYLAQALKKPSVIIGVEPLEQEEETQARYLIDTRDCYQECLSLYDQCRKNIKCIFSIQIEEAVSIILEESQDKGKIYTLPSIKTSIDNRKIDYLEI